MIEIKLPCAIGTRIRDKEENFEMRIIGYQIRGNGNPLCPSHRVYAETKECLIAIYDGAFPDSIEVIGF